MVASAPALVPLLFGEVWTDVSLILPGCAVALAVLGPVGVSAHAYLYSIGDSRTPLWAGVAGIVVRLACTFALLPGVGVTAIGVGWAAGAVVELPLLLRRVRRESGTRLWPRVLTPALSAVLPSVLGWRVATELGVTVPSALAGAAIALIGSLALMVVVGRRQLADSIRFTTRATRAAWSGLRRTPGRA
jgi:O-antigen/teichoic acid export membrane protein